MQDARGFPIGGYSMMQIKSSGIATLNGPRRFYSVRLPTLHVRCTQNTLAVGILLGDQVRSQRSELVHHVVQQIEIATAIHRL